MKILIIDNGTKYLRQLKSLFKAEELEVIDYAGIKNTQPKKYDLIVLSGGHKFPVVGHKVKLKRELELIKNGRTPILGICYGFELIASAFGAKLAKMSGKEKGILPLTIDKSDKIFKNLAGLSVYEAHRWVVTKLPPALAGLAHSRDGIEIIKHKKKLIWGMQFHPEILVKKNNGRIIVKNLLRLI